MNQKSYAIVITLLFVSTSVLQAKFFLPAEPETALFVKETLLEAGYNRVMVGKVKVGYRKEGFACDGWHLLVPITDAQLKEARELAQQCDVEMLKKEVGLLLKKEKEVCDIIMLAKKGDASRKNEVHRLYSDLIISSLFRLKSSDIPLSKKRKLYEWKAFIVHEMRHYTDRHVAGSIIAKVVNLGFGRLIDHHHECKADEEIIKRFSKRPDILWASAHSFAELALNTRLALAVGKSFKTKAYQFFNGDSTSRVEKFGKVLIGGDPHNSHRERAEYFMKAASKL